MFNNTYSRLPPPACRCERDCIKKKKNNNGYVDEWSLGRLNTLYTHTHTHTLIYTDRDNILMTYRIMREDGRT